MPREGVLYTCIAISIDSVMKIEKKYPQVYSDEFNYKVKKKKMAGFIDAELESDFDSDSE